MALSSLPHVNYTWGTCTAPPPHFVLFIILLSCEISISKRRGHIRWKYSHYFNFIMPKRVKPTLVPAVTLKGDKWRYRDFLKDA